MSSANCIPSQPPLQPLLQPYDSAFSDQLAHSEAYWQSFNNGASFLQPFFPEAIPLPNDGLSITHSDPPIFYQQLPVVAKKEGENIGNALKHKKARAIEACEACRYRKQRCDEGLPCSFCKQYGLDCNYRSTTPNKYLFPKVSLPSRRELTSLRFDKIVDLMATWMSTHSDGLSALAEKIDNFELLLQKAECRRSDQGPVVAPGKELNSDYPQKPIQINRRSTRQPVAQWPQVLQLLTDTDVYFGRDYIVSSEDRPVLRLRPNELREEQIKNEEVISPEMPVTTPAKLDMDLADLDAARIRLLYDGFLKHIATFYSFVDREQMCVHFHGFLQECHKSRSRESQSRSPIHPEGERSPKRRRTESPQPDSKKMRMERSLRNALILVALAVGEVTKHQRPLSSTSDPLAPFTYSPEHEKLCLIPGISYFAAAISIIGDHMDGHDLIHAQLFLLAGIYKAQLARLNEASCWYSMAGRILTHLIRRRHLYEGQEPDTSTQEWGRRSFHSIQPYRSSQDDLILRAAWACLQLEDEILPELEVPSSGLERLKDILLLPVPAASGSRTTQHKSPNGGMEERQHLTYTAQLRLGKVLDGIQTLVCSHGSLHLSQDEIAQSFKHHGAVLQRWRNQLAPALRWEDQDAAPEDALQARLRHRYWEAKIRILRPFLYYTLHKDCPLNSQSEASIANEREIKPSNHILAAIDSMSRTSGDQELQCLAELCLEAVKQSLRVYYGISGRLIVSNVQSTAHGRFENVLMLVAAYKSGCFPSIVTTKEVQQELGKATGFLKQLSPISPTAAADCSILEGISRALFSAT